MVHAQEFRIRADEAGTFMKRGLIAKGQRTYFYFFLPFPGFLLGGTRNSIFQNATNHESVLLILLLYH